MITPESVEEAAAFVRARTKHGPADIGVICGSGLGCIADVLEDQDVIPYVDIPHFPVPTAIAHKGNLIIGRLSGRTIICMQGRYHGYEGYSQQQITLPIRVLHKLGVKRLFITNAAGGLNANYRMGHFMIITDQINLAGLFGLNPAVGLNDERFGDRFPQLSGVYDKELIRIAQDVAKEQGFVDDVKCGVYCMIFGPVFATPAENIFLQQRIGADAIGMSTCSEVIVAAQLGMKVLGVSVITDTIAEYDETGPAVPKLIFEQLEKSAGRLATYAHEIIKRM